MLIFGIILLITLTLVGAVPVIGVAILMKYVLLKKRQLLPFHFVISNGLIISALIALYPSGIFDSEGDLYFPYFFVPGSPVFLIGDYVSGALNDLFFAHLPYQCANTLLLVVIPGLIGIILGRFQWYALGCLWIRYKPALKNYTKKRMTSNAWKGVCQGKSPAEILSPFSQDSNEDGLS